MDESSFSRLFSCFTKHTLEKSDPMEEPQATLPLTWLSMFFFSFLSPMGFQAYADGCKHCTSFYTIQPGDTCYQISTTEGVIAEDLLHLNPLLNCSSLQVDQKLCIEGPPDKSTCSQLYLAKEGDTCPSIASSYSLSTAHFMFLNPRINCTSLQVGQLACVAPCIKRKGNGRRHGEHVLADYIGAIGPIRLQDVPIGDGVKHYFILAFAIDANPGGTYQKGSFEKYWQPSITPEAIAAVKAANPNVRVLMSLSGYSLYIQSTGQTKVLEWYDPINPNSWLKNATHSITAFVKQYNLDGIDIDYETFPQSKAFPFLIGELIKGLKEKKVISLATMAPYESVATHYRKLYKNYGRYFDLVNYQFYANNYSSVAEYVAGYNKVAAWFPRRKLMASLEVGPSARGPSADVFFEAFSKIAEMDEKKKKQLPGIFLWAADHSKHEGFLVEKVAQCKL